MRRLGISFAVLVLFLLGSGHTSPPDDDYFAIRKNFEIFGSIYEDLVLEYVDEVDAERMMRAGIQAMLDELDPYTVFFDEAANEQMDIAVRGKTASPGLSIGGRNGQLIVTSPEAGASGYRQGIRTGDIITSIDGRASTDLTASDARTLLYGEPGTTVEVVVDREGREDPLHFVLTRERLRFTNVAFAGLLGNDAGTAAAYVKLDRFGRNAGREVRRALDSLADASTPIILDLRDNPGGLLGEAVSIVSMFLPPGTPVVSTIGRSDASAQLYKTEGRPRYRDQPLFVVVNELSASASEIVAGALQDHDRAVILGSGTFGKGLVQIVNPLPYNTSLKITVSRYFIPSGRSIQRMEVDNALNGVPDSLRRAFRTRNGRVVYDGNGIDPDVATLPSGEGEFIEALQRRSAFFFFANYYAGRVSGLDDSFRVSDDIIEEFRGWLETQDFEYETEPERLLTQLRESAHRAGYSSAISDEIAGVLRTEKSRDFERYAEEIRNNLQREILSRFRSEAEIYRSFGTMDASVVQALELVADTDEYASILKTG